MWSTSRRMRRSAVARSSLRFLATRRRSTTFIVYRKHAAGKRKVQKDDEVNTQKGVLIQHYPDSGNLPPGYQDSGYISPEYHSDIDGEIPSAPISPSTEQQKIENALREYMIKASQALEYYHDKHPGDRYTPVHVNLKQLVHIIDKAGYYIHMNFKAENLETKAEEIFFAELLLPYKCCIKDYIVTACDIIGPECLGGLRHVYVPNNTLFGFDAMDVKNCYACYDNVKHPEGSNTYQAGHMGHYGYDYQ